MEKKKILKNTVIAVGAVIGTYYLYKGWYIYLREPPIGNENWRSFYRRDGQPKKAFDNKTIAAKVALEMTYEYAEPLDSYKCSDGMYRVGHKLRPANAPFVALASVKKIFK